MIIAYIAFVIILPLNHVVGIPIIVFSSLLGVAFAFLPLADRPLDHWVGAFFKAVHSPTQASWRSRTSPDTKIDTRDPAFKNRLGVYLSSLGISPTPPLPLTRIKPENFNQTPKVEATQLQQMAEYIKRLQTKIVDSERQLQEFKSAATHYQPIPTPAPAPPAGGPQVKVVESPTPTPTTLTLTTFPNVINGIVTDTAGNYLEGAIVSIHDKDGLPIRALKTNKLGQFSGATPLADGIYTVIFEKDSLEFETLQTELNGSVLAPLTVRAKKGGI